MGRLTKINEDACQFCKGWDYCMEEDPCFLYEVYEKLSDYEDLEEQLMKSAEIDIDSMVGEFMHYYNLQKENRLIELPCAVGDTVWWISSKKVKRGRIVEIDWNNAAFAFFVESDYFVRFTLQEDEVYFTKEEAERKLGLSWKE